MTAYEMRISDWSSDVCSSDLASHADAAAVDGEGNDALQLACRAELVSSPLVRRLLELGADANRADPAGKRAIDHAAAAGRWSLVAVLDPDYPLPSTVDRKSTRLNSSH